MNDPTPASQQAPTPPETPQTPPEGAGEVAIRPRITITDKHVIALIRKFEDQYPGITAPRICGIIITRYFTDRGASLPGY